MSKEQTYLVVLTTPHHDDKLVVSAIATSPEEAIDMVLEPGAWPECTPEFVALYRPPFSDAEPDRKRANVGSWLRRVYEHKHPRWDVKGEV